MFWPTLESSLIIGVLMCYNLMGFLNSLSCPLLENVSELHAVSVCCGSGWPTAVNLFQKVPSSDLDRTQLHSFDEMARLQSINLQCTLL